MASTRAIARALRSYTNVGMTALEELADFNDAITEAGQAYQPKKAKSKPKAAKKPAAKAPKKAPAKAAKPDDSALTGKQQPKTEPKGKVEPSTQPTRSEAQFRAICNLSRRRGISMEEVETMAMESYGVELDNLSSSDAASFIRNLQTAAA
jgi:hypothetical protein